MVIKNDVIAIFLLGISSIFLAWTASAIKLSSKRMTIIFSTVLDSIENPLLLSVLTLISSDKNSASPKKVI
jgi:hypothetical protein